MSKAVELKERPRSWTIWINGHSACSIPKNSHNAKANAQMIADAVCDFLAKLSWQEEDQDTD